MADEQWAIFEAFEKEAFKERFGTEVRQSQHDEIRARYDALEEEERDGRVMAILALRNQLRQLDAVRNDATRSLLYNGLEDPTEGKVFEDYVGSQDNIGKLAAVAQVDQKTLVGTFGDDDGYIVAHLGDVLEGIKKSQQSATEFVESTEEEQRKSWRKLLFQSKRRALALTGPGWCGYWKIGEGAFGSADLWVKQNTTGRILDRVVSKITFDQAMWDNPSLWVSGLSEQAGSVPTEIESLYNLRPRIGSSSVLRIRNWRIQRDRKMYQMYTEFCSKGDAFGLIKSGTVYGLHPRFEEGNKKRDVSAQGRFVPEPLLWFMFESLARACLLMERGEVDGAGGPAPWDLIIHRDMKLLNIFFGSNTSGVYRGYPEPKLGDFGLCVIAPSKNNPARDDEGNEIERGPEDIPLMGTHGHIPPEQQQILKAKGVTEPMTAATNVWGVGVLLYSMVACEDGLFAQFDGKLGKTYDNPKNWKVPPFDTSARAHYSEALLGLIRECLEYSPAKRPSPDALMRAIRENTAPGKNDESDGLRLADADDPRFLTDHGVQFLVDDRFTPGTDLLKWTPPEGMAAMPDPPDELALVPGEEDPLGGDPGGLIGPEGEDSSEDGEPDGPGGDAGGASDLSGTDDSESDDNDDPPPPKGGKGKKRKPKAPPAGKKPPPGKRSKTAAAAAPPKKKKGGKAPSKPPAEVESDIEGPDEESDDNSDLPSKPKPKAKPKPTKAPPPPPPPKVAPAPKGGGTKASTKPKAKAAAAPKAAPRGEKATAAASRQARADKRTGK